MPYSVEIDLHGHTVESAGKVLTQRLKQLPNDVREVTVLNGFHGGKCISTAFGVMIALIPITPELHCEIWCADIKIRKLREKFSD